MSFKIPDFHIPGVFDWEKRKAQMNACMARGLESFSEQPQRSGHLTLACYGPSLKRTYRDITGPVLSVSGAHDFLIEHGRTPDWHAIADPREDNARMLKHANDRTTYLLASVCHPAVFDALKGRKVLVWHLYTQSECKDWMRDADPHGVMVYGGSTVGLRCLEIAHALGFRALDVHGMDSCFDSAEKQWAGEHTGKRHTVTYVQIGKHPRPFATSALMIQQAREMVNFIDTHEIKVRIRGDGMIAAMMKQINRKQQDNRKSQPLQRAA